MHAVVVIVLFVMVFVVVYLLIVESKGYFMTKRISTHSCRHLLQPWNSSCSLIVNGQFY